MKKPILIIIFAGLLVMIGWTVYDFVDFGDDEELTEEQEGGMITSDSPGQDENGEVNDLSEAGLGKGKKAPDFELETLDGETVKLSDYKGEKVIVNFWATWCPPCREEIPDLQKLYDNKDIEILAIDLTETEQSMEDVEEFVFDEFEMTFPVLLDEESKIAEMYQVMAYPTSYLVDSEGTIQFLAMGAMTYEQMEKEVDKMD
ncbi:MAG TPA: TlpA disulfide reductase family protein [Pseudogracilibacillus sp.]|nr:TlpA disulfide reductase family protein [Pseudogracilibacillus sp.]